MKTLLKQYFGYDEFRPLQEEIINHVVAQNDCFVLMPTGGGKSLCYQLPALKLDGVTLVISPLIALMKDQVDALRACGVKAEYINSSLSAEHIETICERVQAGEVKILYVAPERFALSKFQEFLKSLPLALIAVDEAHCISEWGHDFRTDYRNLNRLKKLFPETPLIALTATATQKVREDIVNQLELQQARVFVSSFDRENLRVSVIEKKQAFTKLVHLLQKYKHESVIIYCFSRKDTETLAENLTLNGFSARAYHAGLEANERSRVQDLFIKDEVNIIVATIAFGMGIDKPDVRLVVHYTYPKTLEGYYQEIGRAGRDGLPSECIMLYTYADTHKHEFFINRMDDDILKGRAQEKLEEVSTYAELMTCRKKFLLSYFGEEMAREQCGACDVCLAEKETVDVTEAAKKILSAVIRTENRFGKNYIIDVLLGKKIQKIMRNGHNELSVFGIIKNMPESDLGQVVTYLIERGLLRKKPGEYATLAITQKGADFLKSAEHLEITRIKADIIAAPVPEGELAYNHELFEELRGLRKQLADEAGVPSFVIFGDVSLREMAAYVPRTDNEFLQITGVGAKKYEKFGALFLELISSFATAHAIEPTPQPSKQAKTAPLIVKERPSAAYAQTRQLLIKKTSIERMAKNQDLKPGTVINHIEKMIDAGERLDLEYLKLPKTRYEEICAAYEACGDERLKPVFERLKGKYEYDELKLVRVLMRT
ncbi:MAG: DNA helicase RecQ [Candidatus Buchananbacteria bacterium]|nr:DNA helicase RecQ [Candidatus Buchananbacteria bacterium]